MGENNVFIVFHSGWKQKTGMIIRDWEGQRRVGVLMGNNSVKGRN